jgi:hypothetical protein
MSHGFKPDPKIPGRQIWKLSGARSIASFACGILTGLLTVGMLSAAVFLGVARRSFSDGALLFLMMGPTTAFMGLLTHYVLRDARGKRGMWIAIEGDSLSLHLPAGRSLIHRPPACHDAVKLTSIEAIETRLEGYPAQGVAMLQRPYLLKCRDRAPIFLFEDRALTSWVQTSDYEPVATAIAQASGTMLKELPMAQGRGGILGVWFTRAPDWSAAPMSLAAQQKLIHRVMLTSAIVAIAGVLVLIASFL